MDERSLLTLVFALYDHPDVRADVKDTYFRYLIRIFQPYQDWVWRFVLLTTSFAPVAALELGATSYDWLDRYAVARHPATTDATLHMLAESDVSRIVRAAAYAALVERSHEATPVMAPPPTIDETLAALRYATVAPNIWQVATEMEDVRVRDAQHDHVLAPARTNNDGAASALARLARRSLHFIAQTSKRDGYFADQELLGVRDLPDWFVAFCANHPTVWLRATAATYQKQAPESDRVFFASREEDRARILHLLQKFVAEENYAMPGGVESLIFRLTDIPEEIAVAAFGGLLTHLSPFTFWFRRFTILSSLRTPSLILDRESASPDWTDRYAIARNPRTPVATRRRLAGEDGNRYVRAAARASLA